MAQARRAIPARVDRVSTRIVTTLALAFSPDGGHLALLGFCNKEHQSLCVEVINARSWRSIALLDAPSERAALAGGALAFSPDGRSLAAGQHTLRVWRTSDWQAAFDIPGPFSRGTFAADVVFGMSFTGDSKSLAAIYRGVWYPQTVEVRTRSQIVDLDTARLAALRSGGTPSYFPVSLVSFYDAATGRKTTDAYPVGHDPRSGGVLSSAATPVGNSSDLYVAWGKAQPSDAPPPRGFAFYAGRIGPGTAEPPFPLPFIESATALTVSRDGATLIAGSSTGNRSSSFGPPKGTSELPRNNSPILIRRAGETTATTTIPAGKIVALALTPRGDLISASKTAGENGPVQVWNPQTGDLLASYAFSGVNPGYSSDWAIDADHRVVAIAKQRAFGSTDQLLISRVP
jgi:WD40 repeat protein